MAGFDVEGIHGLEMFLLRRKQARLHEVAGPLRAAARLGVLGQAWQPGLAALCVELDLPTKRGVARSAHRRRRDRQAPHQQRAWDVVELPRRRCGCDRHSEQVDAVYRALVPWADTVIIAGSVNAAPAPLTATSACSSMRLASMRAQPRVQRARGSGEALGMLALARQAGALLG